MGNLVVSDVKNRVNNWFDVLWNDFDREFSALFRNNGRRVSSMGYPRADVSESDDSIMIEASVPGMSKDQISITYENGMLIISGEAIKRCDNMTYHYKELHRSKFTRAFSVPESVFDVDNIDANLENGILTVTVPKRMKAVDSDGVKHISIS